MPQQRRQFTAKYKFQVALAAVKELKTINEIASHYEVHPTQVKQWKKQLEDGKNPGIHLCPINLLCSPAPGMTKLLASL